MKPQEPLPQKQMSFLDHLEELRRLLIRALAVILVASLASLYFAPRIFHWLQAPLAQVLPKGAHFIATSPFEAYFAYFKIALLFGFFASSPLLFFHFWSFIHPGLKKEERRGIVPLALICASLFVGGALFGYFVVFPTGFGFAVKILGGTGIQLLPKMSDYLSLSLRLLIAFGLIFELPLLLWILGRLSLVKAHQLRQARKYVIVAIVLIAGILTPGPDVLSQVLMAIPLLILFEVGILLVALSERKRRQKVKRKNSNY